MIGGGMHGWTGFGTLGWAEMLAGLLLNLALIVGVVLLVVWLVKRIAAPGRDETPYGRPQEILKMRYARGEITREQYQEMLSDLGG